MSRLWRTRASREKPDREEQSTAAGSLQGTIPRTRQRSRRCVWNEHEMQKKEPGTLLPGPLSPATPRVSLWSSALFCLVLNFALVSEIDELFPLTRQNPPSDSLRRTDFVRQFHSFFTSSSAKSLLNRTEFVIAKDLWNTQRVCSRSRPCWHGKNRFPCSLSETPQGCQPFRETPRVQ
jgi:hypothetical protein